ncbi:hypothetical protein CQW23_18746 [Capsicum baccatum]|uniref:Response regulatory domain-containing protein n=1 Tax=Capsicum baccatum TaxID=33114 RepID=A0A2G2W3S8_CAPBA|nr:hypothetical protein CQW23_18746 [Capsicum baccatum]
MDILGVGPNSSDMGTKNICILLVLDDFTIHHIVSDMLDNQTYQVLHVGKTMDTLNVIWERKSIFNLVLTNIHRLHTNGVDILQIIKNKLNLPTILMSPGDAKYENQVQDCSVAAYVVSFSDTDEMNKFWQKVLEKEKGRKAAEENNDDENASRMPQNVTADTSRDNTSSADTDTAIHARDTKEAVPKKIVEIMNEPGLTREHVARHLQPFQTYFQQGTGGMNGLLDFANSREADHNALIGQHSAFVPRIAHGSNFRVYGDKRKNMLFSIQSGNANQPTNSNSGLEFSGFRLSTDGKSVNFGQKENKVSCQIPEMPDNFIPQEQLSAQRSSGDLEEYSATLFGNEVYVPPIDNYDSIEQQYSATELPQVMLGVNSLGTEIDIKSLLETTEDRSSQLIWE